MTGRATRKKGQLPRLQCRLAQQLPGLELMDVAGIGQAPPRTIALERLTQFSINLHAENRVKPCCLKAEVEPPAPVKSESTVRPFGDQLICRLYGELPGCHFSPAVSAGDLEQELRFRDQVTDVLGQLVEVCVFRHWWIIFTELLLRERRQALHQFDITGQCEQGLVDPAPEAQRERLIPLRQVTASSATAAAGRPQ